MLGLSHLLRQELKISILITNKGFGATLSMYHDSVLKPFNENENLNPNVKLSRSIFGFNLGLFYSM